MVSNVRLAVLSFLFLLTSLFLYTYHQNNIVPLRHSLADFPVAVGQWHQISQVPLSDQVLKILGVDAYINADYVDRNGHRLNFYFSYFTHMNGGKSFHSPRNCMPGAGWDVTSLEPVVVPLAADAGSKITVNRMILQKGSAHQVVLYWYQGRGRVVRSEYGERVYRVLDSLFKHRTDGSFVRVMAPATADNIGEITAVLLDFTGQVYPVLGNYLED